MRFPGATASASGVSVVTPGVLKVRRQNAPVVVRIEKEGFESREITVGWHRSGAALTAAGTAIDLASDRALSLEREEIVLRLQPVRLAEAPSGARR